MGRGRRRRRGQGRAAGGRRLPARPGALPQARREGPEGHPPARPARHRQDAAGQGRRQRVRRAVLRPVGGELRRDVRRPRRGPHPAPVRRGAQAPPGDRLHRRDRRRRRRARLGQQLRARADAQPAAGRDGRLLDHRRLRRDRRVEPAREARSGAPAPRPLRPPDPRLAARRGRPRGDPEGPHAQQAARQGSTSTKIARQHRRPDRRRPGQHRQRGGDRGRPRAAPAGRAGALRQRARARRRGHAVAPRADRARAPGGRLPRGRPCALRRAAAGRRPHAQDLDRPARPGARLHAALPRGGPLPQDPGGADGPDGRAAGRARGRGARVRQRHHRRVRRPQARRGDLALDDPRVGDGHVGQRAPARRRGRRGLRPHARAARRRAAAPRRRGDAARGPARSPSTARSSTSSPMRCCATRCSSATTSSAIMADVADAAAVAPRAACGVAAAEPTNVQQDS